MDFLVWVLLGMAIVQGFVIRRLSLHITQIFNENRHRDHAISSIGQSVLTLAERVGKLDKGGIYIHDN